MLIPRFGPGPCSGYIQFFVIMEKTWSLGFSWLACEVQVVLFIVGHFWLFLTECLLIGQKKIAIVGMLEELKKLKSIFFSCQRYSIFLTEFLPIG